MSFVEWQPVRWSRDAVVLSYALPPTYGYPFQLSFEIEFAIDKSGVRSTLTATNIGESAAPFGTANHTYLAAGPGGKIDDIVLTVPADTRYVVDDRLIPTGTAPVEGTEYDFRSPRRLGGTRMDTAFTGLARTGGAAVVRFDRPDVGVELWVDDRHDYLQCYTDDSPEGDRPGRQGIAVEPMTCAPNAFVTGDGTIALRPGESHTGSFGWRIAG
ncbi:hypothetical protein GCM10009854_46100 [Saccharopolyspora halophila]|uniref:Aldose 1-epimerase n=2 Tax=Saccharopolyspora halophila TaxID=405551 RepID=A0ABP5TWY2_9PSEU